MDLGGDIPWTPETGVLERHLAQIPEVSPQIPKTVMLGYRPCYGTPGGWPMATSQDLNRAVAFANGAPARPAPAQFLDGYRIVLTKYDDDGISLAVPLGEVV
jgi:hypothetical protein